MMTEKPGRELDMLVAEAIGWLIVDYKDGAGARDKSGLSAIEPIPEYSTNWAAAGPALEWLIKNQQWSAGLILTEVNGKPAIGYQSWADWVIVATGDTWPHTIALAVVEATKVKVPKAA